VTAVDRGGVWRPNPAGHREIPLSDSWFRSCLHLQGTGSFSGAARNVEHHMLRGIQRAVRRVGRTKGPNAPFPRHIFSP